MPKIKPKQPLGIRVAAPLLLAVLIGLIWYCLAHSQLISPALLPAPEKVLVRLGNDLVAGRLLAPTWATIQEALAGCALGAGVAIPLAWLIAHVHLAEVTFSPYLAASQAIPSVALAPLLVIWLGYGLLPVVILCAIMVVFPLVLATVLGLRRIDPEVLDAARVDGAAGFEMIRAIEWPLALPATLTGVRNGFTLSVTGAVVGELVMGGKGLGQLLAIQSQSNDTTGLFATLIVLACLAITIYLTMSALEWLTDPFASRPHWRALIQRIKEN